MLQLHSPERGEGGRRDQAGPVSATQQAQPVRRPQQGLGHNLIVPQVKQQAAPVLHCGHLSNCNAMIWTISATSAQTAAAQSSLGRGSTGVAPRKQMFFTGSHFDGQADSQQQLAA